jgi:hypothetical protein
MTDVAKTDAGCRPLSQGDFALFRQSGGCAGAKVAPRTTRTDGRLMTFDPGEDHEARQLELIREQRPIVAALRSVGYEIEFLFAPPRSEVPEAARHLLEQFLDTPLSLETKLIISDLLESREKAIRARYGEPSRRGARDR